MKLKRKLSYKGHYLYEYVSPEKLTKALKWLKLHNPLYADIDISDDWVEKAIADDQQLVMSMLEHSECMNERSNDNVMNEQSDCTDVEFSSSGNTGECRLVSWCYNLLKEFAGVHGLIVHNVPADGNCLFSSVIYQL